MGQCNILVINGSAFDKCSLVDIKEGRILDSLEARIFDRILYENLRRLIGLKSSKDQGDGILGIRVRR